MSLQPKDPLGMLEAFQQQVDEMLARMHRVGATEGVVERDGRPAVDVFETQAGLVVEVELPGFAVEDVSVKVGRDQLMVEGIKRFEEHCREMNYICMERHFGRFRRVVDLPEGIDLERVQANYVKGVLTILFPRLESKRALVREVPIEQGD